MATVNKGGRPTKESTEQNLYIREQCQLMEKYINELEKICRSPDPSSQIGTIGFMTGELSIRLINVEAALGLNKDA